MNNLSINIELLEKYLAGELSSKEMHFVEKKALEDPFIADALEGLSLSDSRTANLSALQKQLHARVAQQPIQKKRWNITTQRLSIAATSAVLFISISILFWMRSQKPPEAERLSKEVEINLGHTDSLPAELAGSATDMTKATPAAAPKPQADLSKQEVIASTVKASAKTAEAPTSPKELPQVIAAASQNGDMATAASKIEAKAEEAMLNEVLVTGSAKAARAASSMQAALPKLMYYEANISPQQGAQAWNDYLKNAMQGLEFADTLKGKFVRLGFEVNATGQAENISIQTSLNETLDNVAIGLLREGPPWNKDTAAQSNYIKIYFR